MIGTGIFATPSGIFALSGSVGLSLFMWVAGTLIAFAGLLVYIEFGTAIPRNGGEKNYLEYVFRKPRFLATGFYTGYVMLLGWAGSNSVVFGEYILTAARVDVNRFNQRAIGIACITSAFLIHGLALKWGLRLQNALGAIKVIILLIIIIGGFVALGGHVKLDEQPDNFTNAFQGTTGSAYGVVTALYNVIWSYIGYSNANYALSETKNPARTLKIAGPLALGGVAILYMLANIAYFAAVPRADLVGSGRILAATFFRNVMGEKAERALSVFVALSAFGNVLSVIFSQGRIVQELGREGILPFSSFFASNKPFGAPFAGLFAHWVVSMIIMLAPPPGDAYNLSKSEQNLSVGAMLMLSSPQRHFLPLGRRQLVCGRRTDMAILPPRAIQLVSCFPSHASSRHLLLPLERVPHHCAICSPRDTRPERLRALAILATLHHRYRNHLGRWSILDLLGDCPSQDWWL